MRLRKQREYTRDYSTVAKGGFSFALVGVFLAMAAVVMLRTTEMAVSTQIVMAELSAYFFLMGLFPLAFQSEQFPRGKEYQELGVPKLFRRAFQLILVCGLLAAFGLWIDQDVVRRAVPFLILALDIPAVYWLTQGITQLDREAARRQRSYMLCQCGVAGLSALLWLLSISAVPALEICAVAGALVSGGFLCLILLTSIRAG